ncbi:MULTISPECIES: glycosyltransferase [unclassified Brevibacterium]|uniref:glycosyltransferase n=1 Tax=unclassified Brevibacterium TaxID=2614124 RepID=UPI0010920BF6|nr:glycosyltransferase [Brevibacterium sp. S22]TGD30411.1 glycosyltransferase [Brevibacterium sp. S22]
MRYESSAGNRSSAHPGSTSLRTTTTVDLVVPVYDEEDTLASSIETLLASGTGRSTEVTIIIADNASSDSTPRIAAALAAEHPNVEYVRLEAKGRGRALSQVWQSSTADIVAYTDVDLATDIRVLEPMVEVIRSGLADLAIASRLRPGLAVERGIKREIVSRCYNRLLRISLGVRFSDAQCAFKAMSARAAQELLPQIEDTEWFFDTELLTRAEWAGYRIHEFGTDWTDDPDSSVDVISTAWKDIKGIVRLRKDDRAHVSAEPPAPNTGAQILHFIDVGIISTVLYAMILLFGSQIVSAVTANIIALFLSTVANTALNRSHTFGVRAPHHRLTSQLKGLAAFGLCLAFTSAGLAVADGFTGPWASVGTLGVLTLANLAATVVRFVLMRTWVFARGTRLGASNADRQTTTSESGRSTDHLPKAGPGHD